MSFDEWDAVRRQMRKPEPPNYDVRDCFETAAAVNDEMRQRVKRSRETGRSPYEELPSDVEP